MKFDPSKRAWFKNTSKSLSRVLLDEIDRRVTSKTLPLRPPFAENELEFLLHCTRCNACIDACSYQVLQPLAASAGMHYQDTPVMTLKSNACHLCADWPCVVACPTLALTNENDLIYHKESNRVYPLLSRVSIDTTRCLPYQGPECGACDNSCPIDTALEFTNEKPVIHADQCSGCGLCVHACILDPTAIEFKTKKQLQQSGPD